MWITTKILFAQYIFFNLWLTIKWGNYNEFLDPWTYVVHAFSVALIFVYSEFFNKFCKRNFTRTLAGIFLIFFYFIMAKYRYRVRTGFDYAILHDNFFEIFNGEAVGVVQNTLKFKDFMQALAVIPLFIFIQYKWKIFTKNTKTSSKLALGYLSAFVLMIGAGPLPHCEISYIFSTAFDFHFGGYPKSNNYAKTIEDRDVTFEVIDGENNTKKPHIFLINIESFNGLYVDKKTNQHNEITPVFNALKKEGLYIDDFYGNSIQSIKGQYAVLCSNIPLIRGKASYNIKSLDKLNCLPKMLKQYGYKSLFHKCYSNLNFDNTKDFMQAIGFDEITKSQTGHLTPADKERYIWGWGVQDNFSYIQYLDNVEKLAKDGNPTFSMIHTVSHHMKFNQVPEEESKLYKNRMPQNKHEQFLNSLNATDRYLGGFIDELKKRGLYENSLIIITGDHSYPAGEHFLYDNQVSYYQEFFKTPLLMIWPGVIAPEEIKEKTYSHVDVLPTVMDLLGFKGEIPSMGESILDRKGSRALLVQPYNGTYLSVVEWPWKYVWERRSNRDFLFNLAQDPLEKVKVKNEEITKRLKPDLDKIIYSFETYYKK